MNRVGEMQQQTLNDDFFNLYKLNILNGSFSNNYDNTENTSGEASLASTQLSSANPKSDYFYSLMSNNFDFTLLNSADYSNDKENYSANKSNEPQQSFSTATANLLASESQQSLAFNQSLSSSSSSMSRSSSRSRFSSFNESRTSPPASHSLSANRNSFGILDNSGSNQFENQDSRYQAFSSSNEPNVSDLEDASENFMWNITQMALMHVGQGSLPPVCSSNFNSTGYKRKNSSGANVKSVCMNVRAGFSMLAQPTATAQPTSMPPLMFKPLNNKQSIPFPANNNIINKNLSQSQFKPPASYNTGGNSQHQMRSFGRAITNNYRGFQMQRAY